MLFRMRALSAALPPARAESGAALEAEIFGGDGVFGDDSVAELGDLGGAGEGDFVEVAVAVDYHGVLDVQ